MEEIIREYAEGILSAVGGLLILGLLAAVFLGKDSRFAQMIGELISASV
ncbi:MAG: hypothetical protein J6B26_05040 [Agathobacter sp.]|nr:hypothetical protein [Agathobacter sp.]MBQ2283716.1 hypothetical protein [Agathobacter sp.]